MKKSAQGHILSLLTGITLFTSFDTAFAATSTTTMQVTVNVVGHCTITAAPFNFPDYDGSGASLDILSPQTPVTINCPAGEDYEIAASAGSGSFINRTMRNGANILNYNLYTDSAYSTVWNSTTQLITGTGTNAPQTPVVYGKIPAAQTQANTGVYTDTLTLTVTW